MSKKEKEREVPRVDLTKVTEAGYYPILSSFRWTGTGMYTKEVLQVTKSIPTERLLYNVGGRNINVDKHTIIAIGPRLDIDWDSLKDVLHYDGCASFRFGGGPCDCGGADD